jgi:hypothetical protein
MEVVFDINLTDIVEYNLFNLKHHPQLKNRLAIIRTIYFSITAVLVVCGLISLLVLHNTSIGILLCVAGLGLLVYFLYQNNNSRTRKRIIQAVKTQYKKIPNEEICKHRVSLSEEGYHVVTDFRDNKTAWPEFVEIVQTHNYLYLFLKPGQAFIVPARAFRDVAGFNSFAEKAMDYFNQAKKQSI